MTHKFNIGDEVYLRSEIEGLKRGIRRCEIVEVSFVGTVRSGSEILTNPPFYKVTWGSNVFNIEKVRESGLLTPGEAATLLEECKEKVQLG